MTRKSLIESLLAAAAQGAGDDERREARIALRVAWVTERIAALKAAQRRADDAWARLVDPLPDDISDDELEAIPPPPEQAEVDAILAEIEAVRDHDRWPRSLYWGEV